MILNSETVFKDLPENSSDDSIIDTALMALYQSDMGEGYLFERQHNRFDKSTMLRIVSIMSSEKIITIHQGEFDDVYTANYKIEDAGRIIASSGGRVAYQEKIAPESEWLERILYAAKDGKGWHPERRFSLEKYERAFQKLCRNKLIEPYSKDSYLLLPDGEDAIELGGYADWIEHKEKLNADYLRKTNSINIHGPVTSSTINQDSFLRDISSVQTTTAIPSENDKQQNAISSRMLKVIGGVVIGVIISLIVLYIEYKSGYFINK